MEWIPTKQTYLDIFSSNLISVSLADLTSWYHTILAVRFSCDNLNRSQIMPNLM